MRGKIRYESHGTNKMVSLESLLEFKHENDKIRIESLSKIAREGQKAENKESTGI